MKTGTTGTNSWFTTHGFGAARRFYVFSLVVALTLGSIERSKIVSQGGNREGPPHSPGQEIISVASERPMVAESAPLPANDTATEQKSDALGQSIPVLPRQSEALAFSEFDRWMAEYLTSAPSEQLELQDLGRALAARRREALAREIQLDPEGSLRHAVPISSRQLLPPAVADHLEVRVNGDAELVVLASLGAPETGEPAAAITRFVKMKGQTYSAFVYGRRLQQISQSDLPIHGIAVGNLMAVHEDPVRVLESGEAPDPGLRVGNTSGRCPVSAAPASSITSVEVGSQIYHLCRGEHAQAFNQSLRAAEDAQTRTPRESSSTGDGRTWTKGMHSVLFIRVNFADRPEPSIEAASAVALMDQVNKFVQENSFGQTRLKTTVTPVVTLPKSVPWYRANIMTILDDARLAAASAGFDPANFDLDSVFCGSDFSVNQAYVGQKGVWLSSQNPGIACHEFGHNFGLNHANSWATSDGSTIGNGQNREYGNVFDTMGSGSVAGFAFGAYEKHLLDWLPGSAVSDCASNGVFRLHPVDQPTLNDGQRYALRIPKDAQRDYWLEMRRANGYPELENALLVNWSPWAESNGGSQLLNCNPSTEQTRSLRVGQAFYDLDIGLKIMPIQFGTGREEWADVQVTQVYFIPVELSLAPTPLRMVNTAVGRSSAASPGNGGTFTCQVNVPQSGPYSIWVQTRMPSPYQPGSSVSIETDQGQMSTVRNVPATGDQAWNLAGPTNAKFADLGGQRFSLSEGMHTISIHTTESRPDLVRLLITNDPATNLPPILSEVADQNMSADSTLTVPFFVSAIGQPAASLLVQASCDNPNLIPESNLLLDRQQSGWTLTVHSGPAVSGTAGVTLTVIDTFGRLERQTFKVTVTSPIQAAVNRAEPGSTVTLPAGTSLGNVTIGKDLTLEGASADGSVINGSQRDVTLVVQAKCNVTLKGLTIENGRGAGIRNFGTLHLMGCRVRQNQGPGVYNRGVLMMDEVILQHNHASQGGGLDNGNSAVLHTCTIDGNVAEAGAGGMINRKLATLVCEGCCVSRNRGLHGNGGGLNNLGEATLRNCTLAQNVTTDLVGQEAGRSRVVGGGVANSGQIDFANCTLCSNEADWDGGGMNNRGSVIFSNSIIANNVSLKTSVIDCSGTVAILGRTLLGSSAGCSLTSNAAGAILDRNPHLGPLGNYGGATETVALLSGSPAIDAAECGASKIDQRGIARPSGGGCDLGAMPVRQSS